MVARSVIARLHSRGRGQGYTRLRGLSESLLRLLYRGDWPAKLWSWSPTARRVQRVELSHACLPPGRRSLRLAFISDLHLGPTTHSSTLDRAFALIEEAHPQVLLLGGDYVFLDPSAATIEDLRRRVSNLSAPIKLAVMGNHDLWTDHGLIEAALEESGVELLINRSFQLPSPYDDILICGLDDPWSGCPDQDSALQGAKDASLSLCLCHSPDGLLYLGSKVDTC